MCYLKNRWLEKSLIILYVDSYLAGCEMIFVAIKFFQENDSHIFPALVRVFSHEPLGHDFVCKHILARPPKLSKFWSGSMILEKNSQFFFLSIQ